MGCNVLLHSAFCDGIEILTQSVQRKNVESAGDAGCQPFVFFVEIFVPPNGKGVLLVRLQSRCCSSTVAKLSC